MGRIGWLVLGVGAGIFLGKYVFSLPWPQARIADLQDYIDPINPEADSPVELEANRQGY